MKKKTYQNNRSKTQKKQEGSRSETKEKIAKPRADESMQKKAEVTRRYNWDFY